jgi:hypothetical protein
VDKDQLPLSAQTGITGVTDTDTFAKTSVGEAVGQGQLMRVAVRYGDENNASKAKRALILMTLKEVGEGSIAKLEGKTFKTGKILSAKIPQRAIDG